MIKFDLHKFMTESSANPNLTAVESAIDFCQRELNEWIESHPVVYLDGAECDINMISQDKWSSDTHKARLVCIEKIKKCGSN